MVMDQKWAPLDLAYAAGLLDGEGTIGIMCKRRGLSTWHELVIATTLIDGQDLLPALAQTFGGTAIPYKHPQGHYYWRWTLYTREAARFLAAVSPYLRLKQQQAEIALEFARLPHMRGAQRLPKELIVERERLRLALKALHITNRKKEAA